MEMVPSRPPLKLLVSRPPEGEARERLLDDGQLLAALRAGEIRAGAHLYERSRPIVQRTVRRLLKGSVQEHQDLAQEAMVQIVQDIDTYRGECPLDGWIAMLTAHVVYKHLRHRQVERRTFADVVLVDDEIVGPDQPARDVLMRSILERVLIHLDQMEHGRAWAFLLHDVQGYDLRETSQIMSITIAAAQSRLVRGRRELHDRIAADRMLADALEHREGRP